MATTTYQLTGNPALPFNTPNGVVTVFNQLTGEITWQPNLGYTGTEIINYDILCDGLVCDSTTATITVVGVCNDSFSFKAVKNNCTSGIPSSIEYTVLANTVCGKATKAEANWEAYLLSLPIAQIQANLGNCVFTECVLTPCVLAYSLGKITISATPGHTVRIYKENSILFEILVPISGVIVINNDLLQGNIYVTQVSPTGTESQRNCLPFELVEKCHDNTLNSCN